MRVDAVSSPRRRAVGAARWMVLAALAAACSPALNWRVVRIEGAAVTALLPCKPSVYGRSVTLDGSAVPMTVQACTADGRTWAVVHAQLEDPGAVDAALKAMLRASAANLGSDEPRFVPWSPPGATPQPSAGRVHLRGQRPDGRMTTTRSAAFAVGTVVVQASIVGQEVGDEDTAIFFSGLQVRP